MSTSDESIRSIVAELRQKGRTVPTSISEIPGFPFPTFESMRQAVISRRILLQRFSFHYESDIFAILASTTESFASNTYLAMMFVVPLAAIGLGYFHSWWWLLAAIVGPIAGSKGMKRVYNRVVLSSALRSEFEFCFLYFTGQVCLTTTDFGESFYWKKSIGEA